MDTVKVIMLLAGIGLPLLLVLIPGISRPKSPPPSTGTRSDLVDDFVLWGEVNNDSDYRL